jgi:hypothetical protein
MLANYHPGHLILIQVPGEAPNVSFRKCDVVIYEDDLVPTAQSGKQETQVPFEAQVVRAVPFREAEGGIRCAGRKTAVLPTVEDRDDKRAGAWGSRYSI